MDLVWRDIAPFARTLLLELGSDSFQYFDGNLGVLFALQGVQPFREMIHALVRKRHDLGGLLDFLVIRQSLGICEHLSAATFWTHKHRFTLIEDQCHATRGACPGLLEHTIALQRTSLGRLEILFDMLEVLLVHGMFVAFP